MKLSVNTMQDVKDLFRTYALGKLQLLIGMLIAASTAGLAIKIALSLLCDVSVTFSFATGAFLVARVFLFMANHSMPLTDPNVKFMSSERILWNMASFLVTVIIAAIILAVTSIITLIL